MTNAYQTAQNLGLVGTDQQIVDQLRATGITATRIPLADLLFVLNNRGMLVRLIRPADTGEKWAGTVVNMVLALNASGTPEQAGAVNQWFSHITNDRNQFFDTTVPAFSAPFWALSQSMDGLPGMPSADDFAAVAALGGGWRFASLTVEQYLTQKATAEFRQPLEARVTNASALMLERASDTDTPEQLAAKWSQAWTEAV